MTISHYSQTCKTFLGNGAAKITGEKAKEFGCTRVLLVTDKILHELGVINPVIDSLKAAGVEYVIYDKVESDPKDTCCDAGAKVGAENKVDGVIGVGGGSVIDAAKSIDLVIVNGGRTKDWYSTWDYKPLLPLILLPTTSGTGTENTIFSVITDVDTGQKKVTFVVGSLAICDPELTYAMPKDVTSSTGIDAFAHAAEGMTGKITNPMTDLISPESIRLIMKWLPVACNDPKNPQARYEMMKAANFAGIAFSNCSCHFGHAVSQCMGAAFHVPHGISCAWALPETMAYCAEVVPDRVKMVADAMELKYAANISNSDLGLMVADGIRDLMKSLGVKSMADYGITRQQLIDIAEAVTQDNNFDLAPSKLTKAEVEMYLGKMYDKYC